MYTRTFLGLVVLFVIAAGEKTTERKPMVANILDNNIKISTIASLAPIQERTMIPILEARKISAPSISAEIAEVTTLRNDHVLLKFKETARHPLASVTKLMTAIVAREMMSQEERVTITAEDIETEGPAGDFQINEEITITDLVKAMLIVSSNDAATAIGRTYGMQKFITIMGIKAKMLGMENTTFADPTGLSPSNQSSAEDLGKLMKYINEFHPEIWRMTSVPAATVTDQKTGTWRAMKNINEFAGKDDFRGGKTGYTPEARGNLISLFRHQGEDIAIIVLGSEDRFGDTKELYEWAKNR